MSEVEQTVPDMDHSAAEHNNGPTEQELLDAVMANSPIMEEVGGPLPDEEIPEVDPAESEEVVDDQETDEVVSEDEEEEYEEAEEEVDEDGAEEAPTQEAATYDVEELDDFSVNVVIDGETVAVPVQDLVKGYATDSSLSKKGRELGEARKQLEEEKAAAMAEAQQLGEASAAILMGSEQNLAKQYHELEEQIDKARKDGDTYEVNELKDKREQIQKQYWQARKGREELQENINKQKAEAEQAAWQKRMEYFSENIESHVPGFNEEMASDIREFAINEGVPEALLAEVTDPAVVKFINEFRVLKQGVKKGEAKRKTVPTKKAVPTKKPRTQAQKKASKENLIKARAMREDATPEDQDAFLKQFAARSLSNL